MRQTFATLTGFNFSIPTTYRSLVAAMFPAWLQSAEKDARKLKPVPIKIAPMVFKSAPQPQITDVDAVPIPGIIISQLACRVPLDDTFFLNNSLRLLADQTNIKTRTHTQHATKDATLIDIPATKLALRLPDENDLCLAEFDEAALNRLRAYMIVSPPDEATGNETTIAHHLRPHIEYFRTARNRFERFTAWRPLERLFRSRIIKDNVAFDKSAYDVAMNDLYRPLDMLESATPLTHYVPPSHFQRSASYAAPPTYTQLPSSGYTRDFDDRRRRFTDRRDDRRQDFRPPADYHPRHDSRLDRSNPESRRSRDFDRPRNYDTDRPRDNGYDRHRRPASPPRRDFRFRDDEGKICYSCADAHSTFDHDKSENANTTTFKDGTPLKSIYVPGKPGTLVKADDRSAQICIKFNSGTCSHAGDHGEGAHRRAHICGHCHGPHAVCSASADCRRRVNGRIKL
ncbi:hypothetical protein HDZ31DRAFT_62565 [Schizophyllum fasciatum]